MVKALLVEIEVDILGVGGFDVDASGRKIRDGSPGPRFGAFLTALMAEVHRIRSCSLSPAQLPIEQPTTTNQPPVMLPRRQTQKIPSGMLAAMKESNQAILQNMEEDFVRLTLADLMASSIIPADAIIPSTEDGSLKDKDKHSPLYEKFLKHSM